MSKKFLRTQEHLFNPKTKGSFSLANRLYVRKPHRSTAACDATKIFVAKLSHSLDHSRPKTKFWQSKQVAQNGFALVLQVVDFKGNISISS
jgi:hypothetical protein